MVTPKQFGDVEIRVGTVRAATHHPTATTPAIQLTIDFGPHGLKRSSTQITHRYTPTSLEGRQVVAVTNLPPRRIGDFTSEVLVLGAVTAANDVILLTPDRPVPDGCHVS